MRCLDPTQSAACCCENVHVVSGVMFTALPELINTPDYCRIICRWIECLASKTTGQKQAAAEPGIYLQKQKDLHSNGCKHSHLHPLPKPELSCAINTYKIMWQLRVKNSVKMINLEPGQTVMRKKGEPLLASFFLRHCTHFNRSFRSNTTRSFSVVTVCFLLMEIIMEILAAESLGPGHGDEWFDGEEWMDGVPQLSSTVLHVVWRTRQTEACESCHFKYYASHAQI